MNKKAHYSYNCMTSLSPPTLKVALLRRKEIKATTKKTFALEEKKIKEECVLQFFAISFHPSTCFLFLGMVQQAK